MPRPKPVRPTDGELEILAVTWSKGDCTVRDFWDVLNAASPLDRTSVAKRVEGMVRKDLLIVSDDRRPQKFRATLDQEAAYKSYQTDLVKRFFGRATEKLLLHIQNLKRPLSAADRQKILDEIDKMK